MRRFPPPQGEPYSWQWLIRRGVLRSGVAPPDPAGTPFEIDPVTGEVSVSKQVPAVSPAGEGASLEMTPEIIATVGFAVFGLCIGSFLTFVIHRLPRGTSVVTPPSRCPNCNYLLRWSDNVPVLSWVFLRGRCRKCGAPISIRYPIVEILTMLMFLLHLWVFGWSALMIVRVVFATALIALFAIDLEHQLLPNAITLPGIVVGLIASLVLPPGIADAILGTLLG